MTDYSQTILDSPRLILYAFHLRNSLDQSTQTVTATASALWDSVVTLGEKLACDELRNLRETLRCYQLDEYPQWHYLPAQEGGVDEDFLRLLRQNDHLELKLGQMLSGSFDALRIHDTYIADLTWYDNQTLKVGDLSRLNPQGVMFPGPLTASLGQTLVLFAKPTEECHDYAELANSCVTALLPTTMPTPPLKATGQLFGGPLFEFESDAGHLLVWFNLQEQTKQLAGKGENEVNFLNLLGSRHKLRYVNSLARQSYHAARELYSQLEVKVKVFEELTQSATTTDRFDRLDKLVTYTPNLAVKYTHHLRNIQDHHNTIEVNATNYETLLQKLKVQSLTGDDLTLFEQFLAQSHRWQKQLQVDLTYLNNTGSLFDRTINSARSMIEIDTLKQVRETEVENGRRQHELEILVASVASLLEGAVVSAKVNHELPVKLFPSLHLPEPATVFQTVLYHLGEIGVHLGVGVIVAIGVVLVVKGWLGVKGKHH
jgi:hypothetical protein